MPESRWSVVGRKKMSSSQRNLRRKGNKKAIPNIDPEIFKKAKATPCKEWMEATLEQGTEGLMCEFETVKKIMFTSYAPSLNAWLANSDKNRYKDVVCSDYSRVELVSGHEDYIHASWVHGYNRPWKFIAAQAPLENTVLDFWKMAFQEQCPIIAMLCGIIENGRERCFRYWPIKKGETLTFGNYKITNLNKKKFNLISDKDNYMLTTLEVEKIGVEKHLINHLYYQNWPDQGAPLSGGTAFKLMNAIRRNRPANDTKPIIIHCSAGIGRSGTLIAIDICIGRLRDKGTIDVKGTVETLRRMRVMSVQTAAQYVFIHRAVLDAIIFHKYAEKTEKLSEFIADYLEMLGSDGY